MKPKIDSSQNSDGTAQSSPGKRSGAPATCAAQRSRVEARRGRIDALTRLLDDSSAAVWERVRSELVRAGKRALPALRRASQNEIPRVRGRARTILLSRQKEQAARRLMRFACQGELDLERGLWLLSRFHSPQLDIRPYVKALDEMGREVKRRGADVRDPLKRCIVLREYLGKELKFGGSIADYHHPDNVCLHRCIERRAGLPLTLSAIYTLVARRAGLTACALPLPGHVMLRLYAGERSIVLDPYHYGRICSRRDIRRLLSQHGPALNSVWFRDGSDGTLFRRQVLNMAHSAYRRSLITDARTLRRVLSVLEQQAVEPKQPS